jgi:hypothetical protein
MELKFLCFQMWVTIHSDYLPVFHFLNLFNSFCYHVSKMQAISFDFLLSGKQDDLPTLKKKLLFQLVSNYYNLANQSTRIKEFIRKHVGLSSFLICNICSIFSDLIIVLERCYFNMY